MPEFYEKLNHVFEVTMKYFVFGDEASPNVFVTFYAYWICMLHNDGYYSAILIKISFFA